MIKIKKRGEKKRQERRGEIKPKRERKIARKKPLPKQKRQGRKTFKKGGRRRYGICTFLLTLFYT